MIFLDLSQHIMLGLLLLGSVVAFSDGVRFLILAMWFNVFATVLINDGALIGSETGMVLALMTADLLTGYVILLVVEDKAAKTVAYLFFIMMFCYPFASMLGIPAINRVVDLLGLAQIFSLGSHGFGRFVRNGRARFGRVPASRVSPQKIKLVAKADAVVAVVKGKRP